MQAIKAKFTAHSTQSIISKRNIDHMLKVDRRSLLSFSPTSRLYWLLIYINLRNVYAENFTIKVLYKRSLNSQMAVEMNFLSTAS